MLHLIRTLAAIASAIALAACQKLPASAPRSGGQQITITAQTGSEVVLNKHVGTSTPAAAVTRTALPLVAAEATVIPVGVDPDPAPDGQPARRPAPLGKLRINPWTVHAGETLFEALGRFGERADHAVRKPEPYPVWEITTDARFEGAFADALAWLMEGFSHTDPRPVITLYPNQVVRLEAE